MEKAEWFCETLTHLWKKAWRDFCKAIGVTTLIFAFIDILLHNFVQNDFPKEPIFFFPKGHASSSEIQVTPTEWEEEEFGPS